jgi:CHAD domain-containing protein
MNAQTSHDRLWQKRLDALTAVWPDFLDGQTKALHKARVASRRIREALPVVAASAPPHKVRKLKRRLRDLTQFLGPIRELDVELDLLDKQADTDGIPRSALSMIRREVAAQRQALRHHLGDNPPIDIKKLIKKLERIEKREEDKDEKGKGQRAERRGQRAEGKGQRAEGRRKKSDKFEAAWRGVLAARLLSRAKALRASIDAAGPLYTPERIHGVRISTKKLRYALEIAQESGITRAGALVKALKKHQERLGRLHDYQGLLKHVREAEASPSVGSRITELTAYADSLERECRRLHADFLEHRDTLIDTLDEVKYQLVPELTTPVRRQARVSKARTVGEGTHGKRAV